MNFFLYLNIPLYRIIALLYSTWLWIKRCFVTSRNSIRHNNVIFITGTKLFHSHISTFNSIISLNGWWNYYTQLGNASTTQKFLGVSSAKRFSWLHTSILRVHKLQRTTLLFCKYSSAKSNYWLIITMLMTKVIRAGSFEGGFGNGELDMGYILGFHGLGLGKIRAQGLGTCLQIN